MENKNTFTRMVFLSLILSFVISLTKPSDFTTQNNMQETVSKEKKMAIQAPVPHDENIKKQIS